ncbi:MAG: WD40 repeat domain-containing protein [Terracidiphilus sp.]|nr:WD40 repeat domain-containing protein [Terracidiphilus sp.]
MYVSSRTNTRFGSGLSLAILAAIVAATIAVSPHALAQGTHLWTQSQLKEFEKGTPQGVVLTSDGKLREGPALHEILTTPSTFVWSVAVDKNGTAYLGTASPATVLRVGRDGKPFTLFETRDINVQVVRLGPDGAVYAATLPSGKVYQLKPDATVKQDDSSATLVFDAAQFDDSNAANGKSISSKAGSKPHYIWDLTFDQTGRLFIATGGPGAVYRVAAANPQAKGDPVPHQGKPEAFFKSDEAHIRSLAWDAKGNLIAGSDGSGLVYRINPQGKGYVLFEAPRREITAVAVAANGTIYAASVGDKSRNPLPPLPVQEIGTATFTIVQPGSLQTVNPSASVPEGTEIYELAEGQAPHKLWSGKDEIVYALAARPDGLLALSGNRGHIFRIADDGSYADAGHLDAQQGLSLAAVRGVEGMGRILVGTGNTGKLYCLCAAEKHEYTSDVLDAGALARFGRIEVDPGSNGYEILTRTGNVEQPVRGRNNWGWSDWQPLRNGTVASPAGRFLQWRAMLHSGGTVGSVGVNYLPVNTAPVVDNIVVVPGARVNAQNQIGNQQQAVNIAFSSSSSTSQNVIFDAGAGTPLQAVKDKSAITVRWTSQDDNGDKLTYSLFLRGDNETVWRLLKDGLTDSAYSFDATLIPDGGYQIKVVASDAPSHTPEDALTGAKVSDRFEVDTTPPVVSNLRATREEEKCDESHCPSRFRVTFDAEDASSPIAHAEYSLDAGPWQYIEPAGKLSDSRREHYELHLSLDALAGKISEHLITVRVYDRHDNAGVAKTVIAAQEK